MVADAGYVSSIMSIELLTDLSLSDIKETKKNVIQPIFVCIHGLSGFCKPIPAAFISEKH